MKVDKPALGSINSIAALDEIIIGNISFLNPRIFTASCMVSYNAAAVLPVRVNFYFSPDGKNYDTVAYTSFDVDLSAGETVQITNLIDVPAEGYFNVKIENLDPTYAAVGVKTWVTIQEWEDLGS